jgi:diadenosine tetraphosphate (Ap4A) HIT family hydrolase
MCPFCDQSALQKRILHETPQLLLVEDLYPVNKGHALIIPRRHIIDLFAMNEDEWSDLPMMIAAAKTLLDKAYNPDGYNIGANCGSAAGQTVFHMHIHVIPRYKDDVKEPRGGVRNIKKPLVAYR